MKRKIAVALVAVVVIVASLAAFAEKQATSSKSKILLLKSGDKVVAELKLLKIAPNFTLRTTAPTMLDVDKMTGNMNRERFACVSVWRIQ